MRRYIGLFALTVLICGPAGQAWVRAQDRVERRDKKGGSSTVSGKILEETPGGVKMKLAGVGGEQIIPSNDIRRVTYGDLPSQAAIELGKMQAAEDARDFPTLLKGYETVQALPQVKAAPAPVRRYIDFRVASLRGLAAEGDEQLKTAAKGLADFVAAHADGWEYPH